HLAGQVPELVAPDARDARDAARRSGNDEDAGGRGGSAVAVVTSVKDERAGTSARPLTATYRLQLNAEFTLQHARARVPYLHALGVSHLYCSPVLAARAGSTHGYDVADPTQVNPEIGGDEAFVALADAAHAHGMGLVLDIVP